MESYNVNNDLSEQRKSYLSVLLTVTLWVAISLIGFTLASKLDFSIVFWSAFGISLALSFLFKRLERFTVASWCYIGGLLLIFSINLWQYGLNPSSAFLMLIPVMLTLLLFEVKTTIWTGVGAIGLVFVIAALLANIGTAMSFTFVPALIWCVLAGVIYVKEMNISELIHWATDIQKKDSQRAEMFYEKSEQLSTTLRQLTHANAKLEVLNKALEVAQHKAEQASNAKSVFLSNMSHELRTPLNVIIGYTSTMLDMKAMYQDIALPAVYRSDVQLIKDNGYYLLTLINDILDLSKIEAGRLELHCQPVNLSELFQGVIATSIGLTKDKPIQIRSDYPDNLPVVWADPIRVRQIILNLMSNAVKFTKSGSVTLQAHLVDHLVQVSVIDTGIGIPEKALNHIFDRFEQAEHDTDRQYGGTGLGLDISRQLARMHGGELTVQSAVEHGSTFSFTLPISAETQVSEPQPESPAIKPIERAAEASLFTILLAEDEMSMRDMMRRALEGAGHVVADVQDGAQVLNMATGLLPDLIILDVCLPNVDGWEILQGLKHNHDTASIPVIVSTVNEDQARALELGAALYLRKPFSPDELLANVQSLLPYSLGAKKPE